MLAVDPQWLGPDRAAVKGWATLAGPYEFLPLDTRVPKDAFGEEDDLAATQPIRLASADDPTALLIAGGEAELSHPSPRTGLARYMGEGGVAVESVFTADVGLVG